MMTSLCYDIAANNMHRNLKSWTASADAARRFICESRIHQGRLHAPCTQQAASRVKMPQGSRRHPESHHDVMGEHHGTLLHICSQRPPA